MTTVELLGHDRQPLRHRGSTAYSQYGSLPLLQLASVTGIWGLTFLISWLAPVVNQLWEKGWSVPAVRTPAVLLVVAFTAALVFGGARLAFAAPTAETVRVAALAPDRALSELAYAAPDLTSGVRTNAPWRETDTSPPCSTTCSPGPSGRPSPVPR